MTKVTPAGTPKRTRVVPRPAAGSVWEIMDHPMKIRESTAKPIPRYMTDRPHSSFFDSDEAAAFFRNIGEGYSGAHARGNDYRDDSAD
jgi:hypothetical protein